MEPPNKKTKSDKYKYAMYSEEEVKARPAAGKNIKTMKRKEQADRAVRKFLSEAGETNLDYWYYEEPELDSYASCFWFSACIPQML